MMDFSTMLKVITETEIEAYREVWQRSNSSMTQCVGYISDTSSYGMRKSFIYAKRKQKNMPKSYCADSFYSYDPWRPTSADLLATDWLILGQQAPVIKREVWQICSGFNANGKCYWPEKKTIEYPTFKTQEEAEHWIAEIINGEELLREF